MLFLSPSGHMSRPVAKVIVGFSIAVGIVLAFILVLTLSRPAAPLTALPNPNGYDDFIRAGGMLVTDFSDYRDWKEEELRAELKQNSEALKLARVGLSRDCRVPIGNAENLTNHLVELPSVKRLASLFAAEGRLAELENRPKDAAKAYVDEIGVGVQIARGGVIIDVLVGIAVETVCLTRLEKLVPSLDAKTCRETAAALEGLEAKRDSPDTMLRQERDWVRRAYGIKGQISLLFGYKAIAATKRSTLGKMAQRSMRSRALMVALAARAFELEKGQRPATLADLVPGYLKAVPLDPLTGTNLALRP